MPSERVGKVLESNHINHSKFVVKLFEVKRLGL